jgi:hypothetical protein
MEVVTTTCFGLCVGHHQVVHRSVRVNEYNVQKLYNSDVEISRILTVYVYISDNQIVSI